MFSRRDARSYIRNGYFQSERKNRDALALLGKVYVVGESCTVTAKNFPASILLRSVALLRSCSLHAPSQEKNVVVIVDRAFTMFARVPAIVERSAGLCIIKPGDLGFDVTFDRTKGEPSLRLFLRSFLFLFPNHIDPRFLSRSDVVRRCRVSD